MKRHIVLVLLVPILALTLISCDGDVSSGFAKFLGNFGGNVYIDGGLVEANKADVKAATSTIAGLGIGEGAKTVKEDDVINDFGINVTIPVGVTSVMKPQPKADQDKLKDDLASTLNSTQQTAELKEELKKPVSDERKEAVKGTVAVFNSTIEALKTELGSDPNTNKDLKDAIDKLKLDEVGPGDTITEGDVLLVQLMTNLISNTIGTLDEVKGADGLGSGLDDNKDKLLPIINDALFTAQIAEELSGAAGIDFSGQLDLANLLSEMNKSSRTSRDDDDDFDIADFVGSINNLGPELVKMFGMKKISGVYRWEKDGDYRQFINTQQAYRGALEHALTFAEKGSHLGKLKNRGLSFDGSSAIKYLIAVVVTELNAWDTDNTKSIISKTITANEWLATGTAAADTEWVEPVFGEGAGFEDFGKSYGIDDADYVKQIFTNVKRINDVAGIKQLSDLIEEFLGVDGDFDEWFNELIGKGV